jgi:hypothetical protein
VESVHNEMSGTAHGVVQARDIGTAMIGEPAPRPTVPAQAAPPPSAFVNRQEPLALLRLRAETAGRSHPEVVAVRGMQGVGKTALLLQFAAMNRDLFPDGVLSVEFGPLGSAPSEAAARLLVGLGVPEQRIPSTFAQRVAVYRSMSPSVP